MSFLNNPNFFPTPHDVISLMLEGVNITNKIVLEPSAGKGNIIDFLNDNGAQSVLFCEIEKDLQKICESKGKFLTEDFLKVTSADVSHIDLIVMNPPFSADTQHILHAFSIAPSGCKVISLCNLQTIVNPYSQSRKELKFNIDTHGTFQDLGACFKDSERVTGVEVGLITLQKPGADYSTEFEGFYLDDEAEPEGDGIMSYNVVRDLVNRYVESIKIFDRQLEEAERMGSLTAGYFSVNIGMSITNQDKPIKRADFKKEMQKSGWKFIFAKMNLNKYATKELNEDLNKFVEQQTQIPFTMKNIYKMLEIVVGTTGQRMDKAIEEVFDKVTRHYHENRYNVEGWKTNSHYLLTQRFIFPNIVERGWSGEVSTASWSSSNYENIEDLIKAICYITGDNYDNFIDLRNFIRYPYKVKKDGKYLGYDSYFDKYEQFNGAFAYSEKLKNAGHEVDVEHSKVNWGEWINWGYFKIRCYKKGTVHFEFLDKELWARFNQRVAKIKGYPLYEKAPDKRTERQKAKDSEKAQRPTTEAPIKQQPKVLATFSI